MSRWKAAEQWVANLAAGVVCEAAPLRRLARDPEAPGDGREQDRRVVIVPDHGELEGVMRAPGSQVHSKARVDATVRVRYPTLRERVGAEIANAQLVSDGMRLLRALNATSTTLGEGSARQSVAVTASRWRRGTDTDGTPTIEVPVRIRYEEAPG